MQTELFAKPKPLSLDVRGLIPNKKNSKMVITRDPRGRPLARPILITKPEYQKRIEQITESLASQCRCACQIASGGTLTGCSLRSWTLSSLPADDSWTHIPRIRIEAEICEPGHEGAVVTIERL
jgi:hypothetical protein